MEASGDALQDDTDIAQLWDEFSELANARDATAAFTFDPTAQYVASAPPGGVMLGHVNVMQQPGFLPVPPTYGSTHPNMMPPMPPPIPPPQLAGMQQQQQQQAATSSGVWHGAASDATPLSNDAQTPTTRRASTARTAKGGPPTSVGPSVTPNANGDFDITPSKRAVGNEPRRSGGHACGKCGAKPRFGHKCPAKYGQPVPAPSMPPLQPTASAAASASASPAAAAPQGAAAAIGAAIQAVNNAQAIIAP
eukprot:7377292-Prymnesium_polylepis.2